MMPELLPLTLMEDIVSLYESFHVFVAINVFFFAAMGGLGSGSFAVGALPATLAFIWIAINVGIPLYTSILYVALTLVFVGFAFKIARSEAFGDL